MNHTSFSSRDILRAALLVGLGIAFLLPLLFIPMNTYDEGNVLCGAQRVLHGAVPYRDFWSCYAPGQFYLLAALFSFFGESSSVLRFLDVVVRSGIAVCCFFVLRCFVPRAVAYTCFGVILLWLWTIGCPGAAVFTATFFIMASLLLLTYATERKRASLVALAGFLAGLAVLFRHDLGLANVALITGATFLLAVRGSSRHGDASPHVRDVMRYLGFALIPVVAMFSALCFAAGFQDVVDQLIRFPLSTFAEYRALPYPPLASAWPDQYVYYVRHHLIFRTSFVLIPACLLAGLAASGSAILKRVDLQGREMGMVLLSATGLAFVPQVLVRSDFLHLFPLVLPAIMIAYLSYSFFGSRFRVVGIALLLGATVYFALPFGDYSPKFTGEIAPATGQINELIAALKARKGEGSLYVGVENHDRMTANEAGLYFLTGGRFGTKYHELHPGVVTTRRVQEEIVRDLRNHDVRCVVLSAGFWEEPNESRIDHGANVLDSTIAAEYTAVERIGQYTLRERATRP
jgi:hypothetical protein